MAYTVTIENGALLAMLMNGIEAFVLPMGNKSNDKPEEEKGHEVLGYIFGQRKKNEGIRGNYNYNVSFINFDITAETSQKSVTYSILSTELKKAIIKLATPKIKYLGTFHTHPFLLPKGETLTENFDPRICHPSKKDIRDPNANDFELDLILGVMNAQRILNMDTQKLEHNCLQFNIDRFRFVLAAYVRRKDEEHPKPPYPYVAYDQVILKRPKGLGWKAKQLDLPPEIKTEIYDIGIRSELE